MKSQTDTWQPQQTHGQNLRIFKMEETIQVLDQNFALNQKKEALYFKINDNCDMKDIQNNTWYLAVYTW